ncbi:hypothetical protein FRC08_016134 [Ceratobasidium sp. 394]|nr:hypothetical protein FRC08_016134 [Ceratobasidium sp. 394]
MPGIPNESLGKKLKDYLLQEYNTNEVLSDSAVEALNSSNTIKKILARDNVTATTLRNLIRLPLVPARLLSLEGTRIIPALMGLYRDYCQDHAPYEYEFGFYCIEAIMFILGIGLLVSADGLRSYVAQAKRIPSPKPTRRLHILLEEHLDPHFRKDETSENEVYYLWGFNQSTQTLASSLGGFTADDFRYLINTIWKHRKPMFWAYSITSTSPAWCYGIYVLWLVNTHILKDKALFPKIFALGFRLELSSVSHQYNVLSRVIHRAGWAGSYKHSAVDSEDARLMIKEYYRYLTSRLQRDWRTVPFCMLSIYEIVAELNDFEVFREHLKSHLRILWSHGVLLDDNWTRTSTEECFQNKQSLMHFADATVRLIRTTIHKASPEESTVYISILFTSGDFVNLMARFLLGFVPPSNSAVPLEQFIANLANQLKNFNESLVDFAAMLATEVSDSEKAFAYNLGLRADWIKVLNFLRERQQALDVESQPALAGYIATLRGVWTKFGRMVPYVSSTQCANPDCGQLNPPMKCGRCNQALYCNQECQKRYAYNLVVRHIVIADG